MIEHYKAITSNHLLTNVSNLGSYMVSGEDVSLQLLEIKDTFEFSELLYLTTCNRVVYLVYSEQKIDDEMLISFFSKISPNLDLEEVSDLLSNIAVYEGLEAIRHIMEVAGSIDSLVVGEREIFRQFREAYRFCQESHLTGDKLRLLEKKVVHTVKNIHTNTRIGEKPLSIASLAMSSLISNVEQPKGNTILMVGAGETNKLLCKLLKPKELGSYSVFNRTLTNAKSLAKFVEGEAYPLDSLGNSHLDFDVMVVTTSSQEPIITQPIYDKIVNGSVKKRIIIDLSVPKNVAFPVTELPNVKYVSIDELKELASLNLAHRKNEIVLAKEIIKESLTQFPKDYQEREIEIALSDVPQEVQKIKKKALNDVYKKRIDLMPEDAQQLIHEMMNYMEQKCISAPIKAAKRKIL